MVIIDLENIFRSMMRNSKLYIGHLTNGIKDGGMARNNAFYKYAKSKGHKIYNLYDSNFLIRIYKIVSVLYTSFFWQKKSVLLHLGTIYLVFPKKLLNSKIGLNFFSFWIKKISEKNELYLEINDLPYQQAVDLDLKIEKFYLNFQKIIFDRDFKLHYIFAAHKMRDFIVKHYNIPLKQTQIIINGAPSSDLSSNKDFFNGYDPSKIKFVYAGTLNKGRGIEDLLNVFKASPHYLFLVGGQGEWIKDFDNIIYLGGYQENVAKEIVSQCDIGVVHYDEEKEYYNICYPTKYSFYISAGIPIISTELEEAKFVLKKYNVTYFLPFKNWNSFINEIKKEDLQQKSRDIAGIKNNFDWDFIMKKLEF